ncbi:MAG: winged helix-turn-helix transcriptional regulator [Deltaproteobacteria bacterium]|nr:winged helix-turn-helix transcriptional regulator [Deltaproteobacteria bacterium]
MPLQSDIDPSTEPLARVFRALGDETRVRLVTLLCAGELCVCHLVAALDLPQPSVSRHLAVLRNAGVVRQRREGAWMYYALAEQQDPATADVMRSLATSLGGPERRADVERLRRSLGPGACG